MVFKIVEKEIWIFGILHKKDVYKETTKRLKIEIETREDYEGHARHT